MQEYEHVEILLAEDNPHDAELAIRGLERHKLANKVTWVKNGEEALDFLFRRGAFAGRTTAGPRLILLDLKMPKVDGIEVTRIVKGDERTKHIPVVIMTSSQEERDVANSYSCGANSYIVKPLDFKSLVDVAAQVGFYWLAINRAP
jgi:two-component system response regulator